MNKFIFDVDGTLTPSRGLIDLEFKQFFNQFCRNNPVYLVTGSDKVKTVEQIGEDTYNLCHTVYNCSGNDVWQGNKHVQTSDWQLPDLARVFLNNCLYESDFSIRTGNHIEERPGMVNFSIVGRNANLEQRQAWLDYEAWNGDRRKIADAFNVMFLDLEARPGGETGIDIAPKGLDKSQIVVDFDPDDYIVFFGDAMHEGGNDEPLADVLFKSYQGTNHWIEGWQETLSILERYYL